MVTTLEGIVFLGWGELLVVTEREHFCEWVQLGWWHGKLFPQVWGAQPSLLNRSILWKAPDAWVLTHKFSTRIMWGSPCLLAYDTFSSIRIPTTFAHVRTPSFLGLEWFFKEIQKVVKFSCETTWRGGNRNRLANTHYPGKWIASVSVSTEEQGQPLLHQLVDLSRSLSTVFALLTLYHFPFTTFVRHHSTRTSVCSRKLLESDSPLVWCDEN